MKPSKNEWQEALIERYGKDIYTKIVSGKVAVCGLGGLGSHIATTLARAGVKTLILVDFDRVDITNLSEASVTLQEILSDIVCENEELKNNNNFTLAAFSYKTKVQKQKGEVVDELI